MNLSKSTAKKEWDAAVLAANNAQAAHFVSRVEEGKRSSPKSKSNKAALDVIESPVVSPTTVAGKDAPHQVRQSHATVPASSFSPVNTGKQHQGFNVAAQMGQGVYADRKFRRAEIKDARQQEKQDYVVRFNG